MGRIIDFFAIIVTLFGTAVSLGIGALQIQSGFTILSGVSPEGNAFIICAIAVLTAIFIMSAVSGVKRGIRMLSNTNMFLTGILGLFIAKISRGRTLREFVTTVVVVPSAIVMTWFIIYGGTAIYMTLDGIDLQSGGTSEEVLFQLLGNLPFGAVTSVVAVIAVVIFFVTAADSASIVMASMSQSGRPEPS